MEYESIILKDEITVRKIYTIHYFEYMKNFEFWEKPMISGSSSAWTRAKSRFWTIS